MRYVIGLPVCLVAISGFLWFTSQGSYRVGADHRPDRAASVERLTSGAGPNSSQITLTPDTAAGPAFDPILVTPCTLTPIQEQNVSSQIDGILTEVTVKLGATVRVGDRLAQLDDQKLRLQIELLQIKASSDSSEKIAHALFEEADAKVKYAEKANQGGLTSVPELEVKTYLAQRERFSHEIKKAREDRDEARKELDKARAHLRMHQIGSALEGQVVRILKKPGETVKTGETLFRLARTDRLRIEGFCKVQNATQLKPGTRALVEPELQGAQLVQLIGHTAPVNCLAMAEDGKVLASASDDGAVLLWSWPGGARVAALQHPAPVLAVDIRRVGTGEDARYVIVTGGEDRLVRVWSYVPGGNADGPIAELAGHDDAVRSVCLTPDGTACISGGEDRRIGWWDLQGVVGAASTQVRWIHSGATAKFAAHQGGVVHVQYASPGVLISTGSDNVQKVWQIDGGHVKLVKVHQGRSGDVARLGVSGDGTRILLDHGDELRILDRDSGAVASTLHNTKNIRFEEFARFSPSDRLVLSSSADGRVQLWRKPVEPKDRAAQVQAFLAAPAQVLLPNLGGYELRHYQMPKAAQARAGVFAPDESVFFTAGSDRLIRVWSIPPATEWEPREATLTYVGSELESGTDLVRIQAEMPNASQPWRPGAFVHLKIFAPAP